MIVTPFVIGGMPGSEPTSAYPFVAISADVCPSCDQPDPGSPRRLVFWEPALMSCVAAPKSAAVLAPAPYLLTVLVSCALDVPDAFAAYPLPDASSSVTVTPGSTHSLPSTTAL